MKKIIYTLGGIIGYSNLIKIGLNHFSSLYRSTGGKVLYVSKDLSHIKVKLPLTRKTRNYLGILYGGHMYSFTDAIYVLQLILILGKDYIVLDKSANIKYKRPGTTTLFANFILTNSFIQELKIKVDKNGETQVVLKNNLIDKDGTVYAEIEKVIYIATKSFFKIKKQQKINKYKKT